MAWERRGNNFYYYQGVREDRRVRKRYIGRGEVAEVLAHTDETMARDRRARVMGERAELGEMRSLLESADKMGDVAESLARAEMVAAGYRQHNSEWRRRRDA
jgi:hypothetical protein